MSMNSAEKIYEIMQKFQKASFRARVIGKVAHGEIMMLKCIKNNSDDFGITISALSEWFEISKPAVSQMINNLEDKGYVERIASKKDRRIVYVKLTEDGNNTLEHEQKKFLEKLNKIFEKLGEEDGKSLLRILEKLYVISCEHMIKKD